MPRRRTNRPSLAQAAAFDQYLRAWQHRLGLAGWRIEKSERLAKDAMAEVDFDVPAKLATYRLGDWGGEAITDASLEATAVHELLHVLLHDLIVTAQDRQASDEQLAAAEHAVINVLERLLVPR